MIRSNHRRAGFRLPIFAFMIWDSWNSPSDCNAAKPSPCTNSIRSATLFRAAFSLARASASAETSVAMILASGHFAASAMAMQPVPVPKSKTLSG